MCRRGWLYCLPPLDPKSYKSADLFLSLLSSNDERKTILVLSGRREGSHRNHRQGVFLLNTLWALFVEFISKRESRLSVGGSDELVDIDHIVVYHSSGHFERSRICKQSRSRAAGPIGDRQCEFVVCLRRVITSYVVVGSVDVVRLAAAQSSSRSQRFPTVLLCMSKCD